MHFCATQHFEQLLPRQAAMKLRARAPLLAYFDEIGRVGSSDDMYGYIVVAQAEQQPGLVFSRFDATDRKQSGALILPRLRGLGVSADPRDDHWNLTHSQLHQAVAGLNRAIRQQDACPAQQTCLERMVPVHVCSPTAV